MINKTEQEIDYSINQLTKRQDEEWKYSIEITLNEHYTTTSMYYVTKDKNGKIISKSTQPWHLQFNNFISLPVE